MPVKYTRQLWSKTGMISLSTSEVFIKRTAGAGSSASPFTERYLCKMYGPVPYVCISGGGGGIAGSTFFKCMDESARRLQVHVHAHLVVYCTPGKNVSLFKRIPRLHLQAMPLLNFIHATFV